jgi:hypothetical protein
MSKTDQNIKTNNRSLNDEMSSKPKHFKREKLSAIKNAFLEWSQSVTYHCFPKIFKENTLFCMRFTWAFTFLALKILTLIVLTQIVQAYFQYSVVSTIQSVNEIPTQFPTVTICNADPFTTKKAQTFIEQLFLKTFGKNLSAMNYTEAVELLNDKRDYFYQVVKSNAANPDYGNENRKLLGFDMKSHLKNCMFSGLPCDWESDFHRYYNFDYGNCFQFNANLNMSNKERDVSTLKYSLLTGDKYGLRLRLFVTHENKYSLSRIHGLKVFIHNQSLKYPSYLDTFLSVKPGEETNIAIDKVLVSHAPEPYSECIDLSNGFNSDVYRFMLNLNFTYRQKDCNLFNGQKSIQTACQCFHTSLPKYSNEINQPCLNISQLNCALQASLIGLKNPSIYLNESKTQCPLECDSMAFQAQVTSLEHPSLKDYNFFINDQTAVSGVKSQYDSDSVDVSTFDLFKKNFYSINVYFTSNSFTRISESPQMTTLSLFASLGGSLGMFLGFSVFSILELFGLFFEIVYVLVVKKHN